MDNFHTEILYITPEEEYTKRVKDDHIKKYAQFFTPVPVAEFMAHWILKNKNIKSILDPAFGLGVFSRIIRKRNNKCRITGYEIDPLILDEAMTYFRNDDKTNIFNKDYMVNDWDNKYDGIICNPPYFKFHDYENKTILKEIEDKLSLKLSGFTNLYTLFLLKAIHQLNINGRAAFIVPSEFLNSDYGKLVKKYLIQNKALRYIIIVNFNSNVFNGALTTASILLFANDNCSETVNFINIDSIQELASINDEISDYPHNTTSLQVPLDILDSNVKWRSYYQPINSKKYKNLIPFSKFGKVVRGIATGSNEYFVFNKSKAKQHNIDNKYLLSCIAKSNDVKNSFFTNDDFQTLKSEDKEIYLINILPTNSNDLFIKEYINVGIKDNIHKKHLTSCRNPWYILEKREPAPIWVSVFNRNGIRFIRNEAKIRNLTTFHCVYLDMFSLPKIDLFFAYLLSNISKDIFNDNRREYGNGLKKFEPNDINNSNIVNLYEISEFNEKQILYLLKQYRQSEIGKMPDFDLLNNINQIFLDIFSN